MWKHSSPEQAASNQLSNVFCLPSAHYSGLNLPSVHYSAQCSVFTIIVAAGWSNSEFLMSLPPSWRSCHFSIAFIICQHPPTPTNIFCQHPPTSISSFLLSPQPQFGRNELSTASFTQTRDCLLHACMFWKAGKHRIFNQFIRAKIQSMNQQSNTQRTALNSDSVCSKIVCI